MDKIYGSVRVKGCFPVQVPKEVDLDCMLAQIHELSEEGSIGNVVINVQLELTGKMDGIIMEYATMGSPWHVADEGELNAH